MAADWPKPGRRHFNRDGASWVLGLGDRRRGGGDVNTGSVGLGKKAGQTDQRRDCQGVGASSRIYGSRRRWNPLERARPAPARDHTRIGKVLAPVLGDRPPVVR